MKAKKDKIVENFVKSKREELEKMIPGFVDDRRFTDIVLNFYERGIRDGAQMMLNRITENVVDGICISNGAECGASIESSGGYFNDNTEDVRLWTIQDAKDGDVLCCESGWTCIFKTLVNDETFSSYCFMDKTKWFCETGSECHTLKEEFVEAYNGKIYPATKEQRNTLMKAMADAGWEFDFDKKELKKIEQKPTENEELTEFDKAVGVSIGTWNPKTPEQIKSVKAVSKKLLKLAKKQINDEQKPAWSEEDERAIGIIKMALEYPYDMEGKWDRKFALDWIKSLKDRYIWKPSDEQMKLLKELVEDNNQRYFYTLLKSLYEQLKKLKGE